MFCEDHFDPKYLRRQFNRTILRRDAIPYPYGEAPASQEIGKTFEEFQMLANRNPFFSGLEFLLKNYFEIT